MPSKEQRDDRENVSNRVSNNTASNGPLYFLKKKNVKETLNGSQARRMLQNSYDFRTMQSDLIKVEHNCFENQSAEILDTYVFSGPTKFSLKKVISP